MLGPTDVCSTAPGPTCVAADVAIPAASRGRRDGMELVTDF